ncbi:MAG: pantoate--beta-alanine ligase [Armatimonadota bacterium]|nr:pantoate--beta-alanine ligase [Armatimonadota bacterium]MCX7778271.1 pantoate--beta-alanine ligase [Armatimonadota bacterium]MDW8026300.1 pantoate--beta-alanine ligase [Armatimonadota bacterium]
MKVVTSVSEMQSCAMRLRMENKVIGFVPTMGYFHEGHLSLMRRARSECDVVIVSIFVNPIQFSPGEDYERYPRDVERDLKMAEDVGVDIIFHPSVEEMYPEGYATYVHVERLTEGLCGAHRPGHFLGVTTVVAKLFNIVMPHKAYFGEKDYQQLMVIKRMVKDLNFPVEIVSCPTVREKDGLAMSSRNVYLQPEERQAALSLSRGLMAAKEMFERGERDANALKRLVEECMRSSKLVRPQYIEVVDAETLEPVERIERDAVIAVAAFVGKARLIDNVILKLG